MSPCPKINAKNTEMIPNSQKAKTQSVHRDLNKYGNPTRIAHIAIGSLMIRSGFDRLGNIHFRRAPSKIRSQK
jgi:hypothetical protein